MNAVYTNTLAQNMPVNSVCSINGVDVLEGVDQLKAGDAEEEEKHRCEAAAQGIVHLQNVAPAMAMKHKGTHCDRGSLKKQKKRSSCHSLLSPQVLCLTKAARKGKGKKQDKRHAFCIHI